MAVLTNIETNVAGSFAATQLTLTASDTLTVESSRVQLLVLDNTTAGSLTVVIDGAGGTTVTVAGLGVVSVASGYSITVAAGASAAVKLSTISAYLQGVVSMTGAAGLKARIFNI